MKQNRISLGRLFDTLPSGPGWISQPLQQQMEGAATGTGIPGTPTPTPGTPEPGATVEYVSKEDFGKTAAMIRGLQTTLTQLQGGMLTPDKLAEFGLLDKHEDGTYKPKPFTPAAPGKEGVPAKRPDDDPLVLTVKRLEKQLADKTVAEEASAKKLAEQDRNSALADALNAAGAVNAKRDFVHLIPNVEKGENGYFVKGTDKYGNPVELSLKDAAEKFLTDSPELKKATSTGGSGTPPAGARTQATAGSGKVIPKTQWQDMQFMSANRDKFMSGEFVRGA